MITHGMLRRFAYLSMTLRSLIDIAFLTGLQNDGLNKALESIRNMAESIIRAQVALRLIETQVINISVLQFDIVTSLRGPNAGCKHGYEGCHIKPRANALSSTRLNAQSRRWLGRLVGDSRNY
jgi:hypothetical protein